jgi:hypothetical protein
MILPTKHIRTHDSLIGVGGHLLAQLETGKTVTELWEEMRDAPGIATFERFVLGLDLLYALGVVELDRGLLKRVQL